MRYAYTHKYPSNRSAFTYWENDTPSRIDLGKQKYGGPFTFEQVEDVKIMLWLILMMLSLFGYQLSGDGFSFTNYIMKTLGCPEKYTFALIIANPTTYSITSCINWNTMLSICHLENLNMLIISV